MRRLIAGLLLSLLAVPVRAQVSNPSRIELKDEGVSKGRIFSLDCIGAELVCAATGGVATITHTPTLVPFARGGTGLSSAADDTTLVSSGTAWAATAITNCPDSAGNHLNYTAASNAFSCGTSAASAGANTALSNLASVAINAPLGLGGTATTFPSIEWNTTQTVDTGMMLTGSTSNHWVIAERADGAFDFAHAAAGDPTLLIHSHNQNTTEWMSLSHNGTSGVIDSGTPIITTTKQFQWTSGGINLLDLVPLGFANAAWSKMMFSTTQASGWDLVLGLPSPSTNALFGNGLIVAETPDLGFNFGHAVQTDPTIFVQSHNQDTVNYTGLSYYGLAGKAVKTLTESSATAVVNIPIAAGSGTGGKLFYTVFAADGTDRQVRAGTVTYAGVNKAGTETCAINGVDGAWTANPTELLDGSAAGAMSAGTLTYAWTASTSPTNGCQFLLNAVSSLTQTTLQIQYQVIQTGPGEVLPQ